MKFIELVCLCIVLSTHQVVGDNVDSLAGHGATTSSSQFFRGGVSQSKRYTDYDDDDPKFSQSHRQTKKGGTKNQGPSPTAVPVVDPCRDLATFTEKYMAFSNQCAKAKTTMALDRMALLEQEGIYCQLLKTPQSGNPPVGTFNQSLYPMMSAYCDPLLNQASTADLALDNIRTIQSAITYSYNELNQVFSQTQALIAKCLSTGFVTGSLTSPPGDCSAGPIPTFNTTCTMIIIPV